MSTASSAPVGLLSKNGRVDHAGLDQRHLDALVVVHLAELLAQRFADRGRGPLRRRVERSGQGAAAGDRAGDQVVAVAALEHVGEGRPDRQGRAEHVRQHHRVPVLGRFLEESAGRPEAGVGEDDVDPAEPLDRRRGERLVLVPLGDVAGLDHDVVAAAEIGGKLVEGLLSAGREDEPVAVGEEALRGGGSDARAGSGDQNRSWVCHGRH